MNTVSNVQPGQAGYSASSPTPADQEWAAHAKAILGNTASTQDQIVNFLVSSADGGKLSDSRQFILQELLHSRRQLSELLTNVLRMLADGAMSVIRNVRS